MAKQGGARLGSDFGSVGRQTEGDVGEGSWWCSSPRICSAVGRRSRLTVKGVWRGGLENGKMYGMECWLMVRTAHLM